MVYLLLMDKVYSYNTILNIIYYTGFTVRSCTHIPQVTKIHTPISQPQQHNHKNTQIISRIHFSYFVKKKKIN